MELKVRSVENTPLTLPWQRRVLEGIIGHIPVYLKETPVSILLKSMSDRYGPASPI